jgi:hypothetical protein
VNENASIIDDSRTRCLCDVGDVDYLAATAIAADGTEHFVLARCDALGDENVCYDPTCSAVRHEQLGALPIEYVKRITISQRNAPLWATDQDDRAAVPDRSHPSWPAVRAAPHRGPGMKAATDVVIEIRELASQKYGNLMTYSDGRRVEQYAEIQLGLVTHHIWHPDAAAEEPRSWRCSLPSDPDVPSPGVYEVTTDPQRQDIHVRVVRVV